MGSIAAISGTKLNYLCLVDADENVFFQFEIIINGLVWFI